MAFRWPSFPPIPFSLSWLHAYAPPFKQKYILLLDSFKFLPFACGPIVMGSVVLVLKSKNVEKHRNILKAKVKIAKDKIYVGGWVQTGNSKDIHTQMQDRRVNVFARKRNTKGCSMLTDT